jgi:hypothetical protein
MDEKRVYVSGARTEVIGEAYLVVESWLVLEEEENLGAVHLEEHTGELSSELGLRGVDLGVKTENRSIVSCQVQFGRV